MENFGKESLAYYHKKKVTIFMITFLAESEGFEPSKPL